MQIFVNEQKLDAEVTGEENLEEIYDEISRWSAEHKKYIIGFRVNEKDIAVGDLQTVTTDGVDRIDFTIGDEMDMVLATVTELDRYVDQVGSVLFEANTLTEKEIRDLNDGLHWVRQIMGSLSTILKLDLEMTTPSLSGKSDETVSIAAVVDSLEQRALELPEKNGRETIDGFLEDLRSLKYFIMKLHLQIRSLSAGVEELIELVEEFEKGIPGIIEEAIHINESFSQGDDRDALESLDGFSEKLHLYVSALYGLDYRMTVEGSDGVFGVEVDGIPFQNITRALTTLLEELSGALEENDIVAAGDILEYELGDRLKEMAPYLSLIRQFVVARNS